MTLTQQQVSSTFALFVVCAVFAAQPVLAADIFAAGKTAIKESAGTGSMVETAILGSGLIGAAVTGLMTRNWFGAVGGFVGGNILWKVGAPLVGLA